MGLSKKVFRSDLDMNKYEILQARLENLASAPGTPGLGQVYYNTVSNNFFGWDGAWKQLDATTLAESATDVTATAAELNLLDLSGLTAGWALLADSPTTASWQAIPAGATTFLGLTDVDTVSYTAQAGYFIRVNATPDGLETLANTKAGLDGAISDGTFVWANDTSTSGWSFVIDDNTMATATTTNLASALSIKTYVDNAVLGGMVYKGAEDASTAPPTGAGILVGWTYTVTVAGNGGGFWTVPLEIGDMIVAEVTNPAAEADWTVVSRDLPAGVTYKYSVTVGNGALTDIPVTHNFGTKDVLVEVYRTGTPWDTIECQVERTDTNTVTLGFNTAPTSAEFTCVVIG